MTEACGALALVLLLQPREVLQRELQQVGGLVPQHLHREALQQLREPRGNLDAHAACARRGAALAPFPRSGLGLRGPRASAPGATGCERGALGPRRGCSVRRQRQSERSPGGLAASPAPPAPSPAAAAPPPARRPAPARAPTWSPETMATRRAGAVPPYKWPPSGGSGNLGRGAEAARSTGAPCANPTHHSAQAHSELVSRNLF